MRHDPERLAAAFLAGDLGEWRRESFETHLLTCDDCWREIQTARRGRMLAESLRQPAPPDLRERLRAVAATPPTAPPRASPAGPLIGVLATAIVTALVTALLAAGLIITHHRPAQPRPITEAITTYQTARPAGTATTGQPPVTTIGAFTWSATARRDLGGLDAVVYLYTDPANRKLLIVRSPQHIPTARGAQRIAPDTTSWTATVHGTALFCADQPGVSWLTLAGDPILARQAGHALGLR